MAVVSTAVLIQLAPIVAEGMKLLFENIQAGRGIPDLIEVDLEQQHIVDDDVMLMLMRERLGRPAPGTSDTTNDNTSSSAVGGNG